MTDVIGTARVDEPRRRRVSRWRRRLIWPAAAIVAAGVVLVPAERARLADSAARWLQGQWASRAAYDDARVAVIDAVDQRAGALDAAVVEQAAVVADREEASALRRMVHAISTRHTWGDDVARARDSAVAALQLEITKLDRDATAQTPAAGYLFASDLDRLVTAAAARVTAMVRAHHLRPVPTKAVQLRPAQALLDHLRSPTDFATGLSLVLSGAHQPHIINLDTGGLTTLRLPRGDIDLQSWAGRIMVVGQHGVQSFDGRGRPGPHFARVAAQVLSTTGTSLWLTSDRGVRRYAADGHPLTPWLARPAGRQAISATGAVIVLLHMRDDTTFIDERWNPLTGALRVLPASCFGGWATAGRTLVAYPCAGDRALTTVDAVTGRERRIRLPGPVADDPLQTFSSLSPAGQVSITLGRDGVRPGLFDLRTGRFLRLPGDGTLTPAAWADQGWILLVDESSFGNGQRPQLALWRPRDGRMTSVRLPPGSDLVGSLPLLPTNGE